MFVFTFVGSAGLEKTVQGFSRVESRRFKNWAPLSSGYDEEP